MKAKYKVTIIESERGWGQRIDEEKLFDTKAEADAFVKKFNAQNTATEVPDWYMVARSPQLIDLDAE